MRKVEAVMVQAIRDLIGNVRDLAFEPSDVGLQLPNLTAQETQIDVLFGHFCPT